MNIIIKTEKEIESMRKGGRELARIMGEIEKEIIPGRNTYEIDKLVRELVFEIGGVAVFDGYGDEDNPYPGAVCVSINNEIVHGIPSRSRIFKSGDIVKIDVGMKYEGMITDMSRTFSCGKIAPNAYKLLKTTKESLNKGIEKIKSGANLNEYAIAVDSYVRAHGFSTIRELVGHGVGRHLHEDPQVLNYKSRENDVILEEGMTLALEPMINEGTRYIKLMNDGWTYVTKDGKLSAHFEDTVVVTKSGCEILTRK